MKKDQKHLFADRLNEVLDRVGFPPKGSGRQIALADIFRISQNGVRKWLEGDSMPQTSRIAEIASRFGVNSDWLMTGRGEMHGNAEKQSPDGNDYHLFLTPEAVSLATKWQALPKQVRDKIAAYVEAAESFQRIDANADKFLSQRAKKKVAQ